MNPVDWFWDAIRKACNDILAIIFNNIAMVGTNDSIFSTLAEAIGELYTFCVNVQEQVTGPVGITMLSLLIMIELLGNITRNNEFLAGENIGQVIYNIGLKFIALKIIIDAAPSLLGLIYEWMRWMAKSISDLATGEALNLGVMQLSEDLPNDGSLIPLLVVLFIAMLISFVSGLAASVLISWRMIKIYLMFAFSPIPLSMLAYDGTRQGGISFLKHFAATCLQGAVLVAVVSFFPFILGTFSLEIGSPDPLAVTSAIAAMMGYFLVLIVSLFGSMKVASTIVGE